MSRRKLLEKNRIITFCRYNHNFFVIFLIKKNSLLSYELLPEHNKLIKILGYALLMNSFSKLKDKRLGSKI